MFPFSKRNFFAVLAIAVIGGLTSCTQQPGLQVAYFETDVTPPIGSPVAYAPTRSVTDSLSARGVVLVPKGQSPIVLCTIDWLAVSNESMDVFKKHLAEAANTKPERVTVHSIHQHDTPWGDITSARILDEYGLADQQFDLVYQDNCIKGTAKALSAAMKSLQTVKLISFGEEKVEKVASNRRILGEDGKVKIVRYSSARDSAAINAPEGLIDPFLKSVSFWNEKEEAIATLNYYATHPQSYYGKGDVNPEFIGLARNAVQKKTGVPQVFFIGAAGNIAAGKYNDGSPEMRPVLTQRVVTAMEKAFEKAQKKEIPGEISWRMAPLTVPIAPHLNPDSIRIKLADSTRTFQERFVNARYKAWLDRNQGGTPLVVTSLQLGDTWLLHLPGEPFIEYQLAAQKFKPEANICTAAYGDDGVIYIGTAEAYNQGGYEVDKRVNFTTSEAEPILLETIKKVLP